VIEGINTQISKQTSFDSMWKLSRELTKISRASSVDDMQKYPSLSSFSLGIPI
jgi:hypothetical protein